MVLRSRPVVLYLFALVLLFILGVVYLPLQRAILPFLWIALTLFGANFKSSELARFGIMLPKLKSWLWPVLLALIIFPPFTIGYFKVWGLPPAFPNVVETAKIFAIQFVWVAIPEEMFFRGYMQTKMYERYPNGLNILGVRVGWAIVITSALFAGGHVVTKPHIARLAIFFPAIIFGWLREKTNSVFPAALFHALCNTLTGSFEWWAG